MDISSISFSVYLAIIPSILLCLYVYRMDVVEKEPVRLLLVLFFIGVLATVPARFFEQTLMSSIDLKYTNIYDSLVLAFLIIALVEEGYKFLVLIISCWKNKEFNYRYDAIVYSVFISLGFATLENILYVQSSGYNVALWRGVISVPAHAFYAIASGFFLGLAKENSIKHNTNKTIGYIFLSFLVPILLHGVFDFLLLTENDILFGIFFSFVAILYLVSYYEIKKTHKGKLLLK
jgi:RsiW-degrading membrane proteinase PrsW (M82 family)